LLTVLYSEGFSDMNTDPFGLYPIRRIALGTGQYTGPQPRMDADQIVAVRDVVAGKAIGGHHTAPVDRSGSGFADLVAAVTIGWDGIGDNQLVLVVTQGYGDGNTSTIDLVVMPYAAPAGGGMHALHQTDTSFRPDSAAALLDEVVTAIKAIEGLVPPK
jgi:hypothetical protein